MNCSKQNDRRFKARWILAGATLVQPKNCAPDIFTNGESVAALDARSTPAERWVQAVAALAGAQLNWHYSGGVAHVLHLGDSASRARVEQAINHIGNTSRVRVMRRYEPEEAGLYRKGVTVPPKNARTGFLSPLSGKQAYI